MSANDATREKRALALIRIAIGAMFIWVFFENLRKGAYRPAGYRGVIEYYLGKSAAPAVWKSVMSFAAGHAAVAGPLQAASELAFGIALVTGTASRLFAAAAGGFLFTLWLSEPGAMPWHQALGNRLAAALIRALYGVPLTDLGPLRAARREVLRSLALREPTYGWAVELPTRGARQGYRVAEVPVSYHPRIGVSKISGTLRGTLAAAWCILTGIVVNRFRTEPRPDEARRPA